MNTIRKRIIFVLFFVGITLSSTLILIFTTITIRHSIEQDTVIAKGRLERAESLILDDINYIGKQVRDYAIWDETYNFIEKYNTQYIESNFSEGLYTNLGMSSVLIFDAASSLIFQKSFNTQNAKVIEKSQELIYQIQKLNEHSQNGQGFLKIGQDVLMYASSPILPTSSTGLSRGSMTMIKTLDAKQLKRIQEITNLPIQLEIANQNNNAPTESTTVNISPQTVQTIKPLLDPQGNLVGYLTLKSDRQFFQQHLQSIITNISVINSSVLGIIITTYIIIDIFILRRLYALFDSISRTADSSTFDSYITINGSDEISKIANSINVLLDKVRKSQTQLQEQTKDLKKLLADRDEQYNLQLNTQKAMLNLLEDEKELQDQLKKEKTSIEGQITERTKELETKNQALEQAHKDISEAWLSVQREKARLTASINSLPNGFILTDQNNNVFMINSAAKSIMNMQEDIYELDAFSQNIKDEFNLEKVVTNARETKQLQLMHDVVAKNRNVNVTVAPILLDPEKQFLGTAIVIDDITERKIMERARDEFFSIASHELRTPLTSIRGNTAMIIQYFGNLLQENKNLKEMIDDIHSSSVRLISIVNDFLNVSRLEMKRMTYKYSYFSLPELTEKVHKELEITAQEKKDTLHLHVTESSLPQVYADPDRVKEVLLNLIGNAIKFTDQGNITTSIHQEETFIHVEVTDSGMGIPKERQELLFRKFQQAGENLYTRDTSKSSGLGLYISKLMIEEMRGTIGLKQSEEGKGSTFFFTLPTTEK